MSHRMEMLEVTASATEASESNPNVEVNKTYWTSVRITTTKASQMVLRLNPEWLMMWSRSRTATTVRARAPRRIR